MDGYHHCPACGKKFRRDHAVRTVSEFDTVEQFDVHNIFEATWLIANTRETSATAKTG